MKREGLLNYCYVSESVKKIDEKGLPIAINDALARILYVLKAKNNSEILLDGSLYVSKRFKNQKTIIKGDEKDVFIACASIS